MKNEVKLQIPFRTDVMGVYHFNVTKNLIFSNELFLHFISIFICLAFSSLSLQYAAISILNFCFFHNVSFSKFSCYLSVDSRSMAY